MVGMASFRHGDPVFVDYPSPGVISAGDVIIVNDTPRIAHRDFATGELAALAAIGGVYEVLCDVATPADKKVYWDAVGHQVTTTASTNKVFGVTVTASTGAAQLIFVRHDPGA